MQQQNAGEAQKKNTEMENGRGEQDTSWVFGRAHPQNHRRQSPRQFFKANHSWSAPAVRRSFDG
ncbi:MAG: hypothetical protein AAGG75_01640 [Bacteroidota bacterium]